MRVVEGGGNLAQIQGLPTNIGSLGVIEYMPFM